MAIFFNLTHGTTLLESSHSFLHLHHLDMCVEKIRDLIACREGTGFDAVVCSVSASARIEPRWRGNFIVTYGTLLLPYIAAFEAGRQLPHDEIPEKFGVQHQKAPDSCESTCISG